MTVYEIRDASGLLVAAHIRHDHPDGSKSFSWRLADGTVGLGGIRVGDLPLYGIECLDGMAPAVVVVEGEKCAEALWSAGIAAVGTVTGAAATPSASVLAELGGRRVVLWPDVDEVGERHMAAVAERLATVASSVSIVEPPEGVPQGWDAADAVAQGRDPHSLIANARSLPTDGKRSQRRTKALEGVVTPLSSVMPRPLEWLWSRRIPAGMLTVLDGDPGLGKSLLTLDLAARVTRGRAMPSESPSTVRKPRGVIILSAEDDPARTIRPRLEAAGADLDRVALVSLRERDGTTQEPLISASDLDAVEEAIESLDVALLIIDPLVAYLPSGLNANRDQDVRRSLAHLKGLAERTGIAIIAVRHLRKAAAENALYRGGGSIGIIGAARAGLLVAPDPDDPSGRRRVLATTKSNLAPEPAALTFSVVAACDVQPHVAWHGESVHRAGDLLKAASQPRQSGARLEAEAVLRDLLALGPVAATEVRTEAAAAGIAPRTLERAKVDLNVRSVRPGGFTGPWAWVLPDPYLATDDRTSPLRRDGDVRVDLARYASEGVDLAIEDDYPRSAWDPSAGDDVPSAEQDLATPAGPS